MLLKSLSFIFSAFLFSQSVFAVNFEKLADDDWISVKTNNFEIITDLNEEKGRNLAEDLEAYRYFSTEVMGLALIQDIKPLKVIAISNSSNFRKLDLPDLWAGVFRTTNFGYSAIANLDGYSVDITKSNEGRHTLFHEYNHFLIRFSGNIQKYPLWYNEGLAEYMATFKVDKNKIYIGDMLQNRTADMFNPQGSLILDSKKIFSTEELPLTSKKDTDKNVMFDFYAQSFYLMHYFKSSPELWASLQNYIQLLNNGYAENYAFKNAFNLTYEELDKNTKAYLKHNMVRHIISLNEGKSTYQKPKVIVTKLDKPSFYVNLSEVLPEFSIFDNETKTKLLEESIALNPNNADIKSRLLHYGFAKDPEKIEREVEATNPKNSIFLTYKADKLANAANFLRAAGVGSWKETMKLARNNYRKSIKSDQSFMLPYIGLGNSYEFVSANELSQEAILGLNTSTLLIPNSRTFGQLADIYIRMDKSIDALPSVRSTIAYSKNKELSPYSLIYENLEMLNDINQTDKKITAEGLEFKSGAIYTGAVEKGNPTGKGKITRPNGSYFEGVFVNGVMQGQGKIVTYGGFIYEGEFQKGIARGHAKISYPENYKSTFYEGDVYYAFPFGKGTQISKAGKYEGDFSYSYKDGSGTFTSQDEKTVLQGKWVEDAYVWPEINGTYFVGSIAENGKRDGNGICVQPKVSKIDSCTYKDGEQQAKDEKI